MRRVLAYEIHDCHLVHERPLLEHRLAERVGAQRVGMMGRSVPRRRKRPADRLGHAALSESGLTTTAEIYPLDCVFFPNPPHLVLLKPETRSPPTHFGAAGKKMAGGWDFKRSCCSEIQPLAAHNTQYVTH